MLVELRNLVRRATDALIDSLNRPMSASQQLSAMVNKNTSAVQALVNAMKPKNPLAEVMRQMIEREQRMLDLIEPPGLRAFRELTSSLENLTKRLRTPF